MKKHLLFLFAALLPLVASAHDFEVDGIYYNITSSTDRTVKVTFKGDSYKTNEYSDSITIPATVTYNRVAYSVTSIEGWAFAYCNSLKSITIPESVTSIGDMAFYGCSNLKTVINYSDLPLQGGSSNYGYVAYYADRVINIDEVIDGYAFKTIEGVHYLTGYMGDNTELTLPADYKGENYQIGERAFCKCSSLTAITIPASVTSIGNSAFRGCSGLTAITIPASVTSIGNSAFSGCSSLAAITIPESVTSIGSGAFSGCSNLTDITIPEGVTSIGMNAFYNCSRLAAITLPESVTSIGSGAFEDCSSLTDITIPESVTSIGNHAFRDCSSLKSITIPEGVTSIGEYAFYNCTRLTSITIPEGVTSIGDDAFYYCTSLTAITIPEGVTSIGDDAFYNCTRLTSIVLPKSVAFISSEAFAYCSGLTDVYCYAKTVPSTNTDAFGSYINRATLHVPASAMNDYENTAPWSGFGRFDTLKVVVENITLNASTATLIEGEDLTLTATVTPEDADNTSVTWSSSNTSVATVDNTGKVTAIAPGTATITATANDGSGVSASCEVEVKEKLLGKCATPTISYVDGKVELTCDTEDATIRSSVRDNNIGDYEVTEYNVIPTYTITAYATKEKYEDSDVATLTLCWVPCEEDHEEDNGILTIPSHPVLISTQGGTITLSGLAEGTEVAVYTTAGTELATATATNGTATLNTDLTAGNIAVVKIGEHSIKVAIK